MEAACRAWELCMNRDPTVIGRIDVVAETFAGVINSFVDPISWKTMVRWVPECRGPVAVCLHTANSLGIHAGHLVISYDPNELCTLQPTITTYAYPSASALSTSLSPTSGAAVSPRTALSVSESSAGIAGVASAWDGRSVTTSCCWLAWRRGQEEKGVVVNDTCTIDDYLHLSSRVARDGQTVHDMQDDCICSEPFIAYLAWLQIDGRWFAWSGSRIPD